MRRAARSQGDNWQSRMGRAGDQSRVVPTRCRWAPCVRGHGPGQGQLPCGFYRPPGCMPATHPAALPDANMRPHPRKINSAEHAGLAGPKRAAAQLLGRECSAAIQGPGDAVASGRVHLFQLARRAPARVQGGAQASRSRSSAARRSERSSRMRRPSPCRASPQSRRAALLGLALPA